MVVPILKIYGERNTGTNYLHQLIRRNLPQVNLLPGVVPVWIQRVSPGLEFPRDLYFFFTFKHNLGWKHAMAPTEAQIQHFPRLNRLFFITLTKNPYAWLLSLYRRPYHLRRRKHRDFIGFLQSPWPAVRRENYPRPYFETPIDLWNQKNRSYMEMKSYASVLHLRYEDLVSDPKQVIEEIARFVGVSPPVEFSNITHSTKGDPLDFEAYRRYYLQQKWREVLTLDAIALINARLEPQVMAFFCYTYL